MGKSSKKGAQKHKKHRHHHRSSSSSSSSSQNEEQWQEVARNDNSDDAPPAGAVVKGPTMPTAADLEQIAKEKPAPVAFALEPFDFDSIGSYRREDKQAIKKAEATTEMEAIMKERELNPTLRQQPTNTGTSKKTTVGDSGLEWHRRALERCKQQAKDEQRSLNEVVSERYGSMEKLMSLINDAEDLHQPSAKKKKFLDPNEKDDRQHRRHHHHHHRHHHHEEKKSWKRTTEDDEQSTSSKTQVRSDEPEETPANDVQSKTEDKQDDLISEENLLELRKQLIRAELAGDDEMTELLRNEIKNIDNLRGNPQEHNASDQQQQHSNDPKVLVLTTIDRYGVEKPVHNAHHPGQERQYGRVTKHDRRKMKKEMRKMREKDRDPERQGLTLNDLVEMERHSTSNSMPVLPSNRHSTAMTADRHLLASTRHLTGWSRIEALAEQKRRQKTFEQCWLCIENLAKSYIFGLLDHWFLCAPPQESLVDGHCFIVPIQHSSSRFHLDDDVLAELDTLKEQLMDLYRKQYNQMPVFIETFKNPRLLPHMYIECIPVPIEQANLVPMYFRKAILESESMWSTNKKLVELNNHRSRTLKTVLPKGLPYFCVEFAPDRSKNENLYGYAHMIEERGQFPLYFGREILGGLMEVDNPLLWMRPSSKESEDIVERKCTYLKQLWKKNTNKSST